MEIHEQKGCAGVVDISQRGSGGVAGICAKPSHGAGVSWSGGHGGVSWDGGHSYGAGGYGGYPATPPTASVPRA